MEKEKLKRLNSSFEAVKEKITVELREIKDEQSLEEYFSTSFTQHHELLQVHSNCKSKETDPPAKGATRRIFTGESEVLFCSETFPINLKLVPEPLQINLSVLFQKKEDDWQVVHHHLSTSSGEKTSSKKKLESLQKQLENRTESLNEALGMLKTNQSQLLRQEKLASLGQLTAGIAHEIKNPLNFITNFSELSVEFVDEIFEHLQKLEKNGTTDEIKELLKDVKSNLHKIYQHGARADSIVKSMLLHSRGGSGKFEATDLNSLVKEYVNLSFHGMRAGKNPINVQIDLELDEKVGLVTINAESFSRVVLNLCKNAFDAMRDKLHNPKKEVALSRPDNGLVVENYLPKLLVKTELQNKNVVLEIEDNGPGVPESIKDKLMMPFFTTKTGSEGTGLGLSITSDIVQAHKGVLEIESEEDKFTRFRILLPKKVE